MLALEHHAYLVTGEAKELIAELKATYPHARHRKLEQLKIEDSREIKEEQSQTEWSGKKKIFIIELDTATLEGQNALLKLLEEPTAETHIFIVVPSAKILLPTVRSRLAKFPQGCTLRTTLKNPDQGMTLDTTLAQKFLIMHLAQRLDWLKTAELPPNFLDQLELALSKRVTLKDPNPKMTLTDWWPDLALARREWHTPGTSHKLLLEHLAVAL